MALSMLDKPETRIDAPWPRWVREDLERNRFNGRVGTKLLSESDKVRVWEIRLKPGERIGFHRHVLDYFWTAVTPGRGRSHHGDGSTLEMSYEAGETRHATYGPGEYKLHDLENIGDTELIFTTVEFLDSANPPLELPDDVRRQAT
jgi:quercetin dioxygenase-like cupin family protein